MGLFAKYIKLTAKEKSLFWEALFYLYFVKIRLQFISVQGIAGKMKEKDKKKEVYNHLLVIQISEAVARADRFTVWKNRCLVKSLAARQMLKKRGISSRFSLGVTLDGNKKLIAHAWLQANGLEIVKKNFDYKELTAIE